MNSPQIGELQQVTKERGCRRGHVSSGHTVQRIAVFEPTCAPSDPNS